MERLLGKANRLENMRIREITLQEIGMKLVDPFETSMDRTVARRIMLVQADVDGVIGWGECVAGETPYYSPETADTAWLILRDFLWPLIKGKDLARLAKYGNCSRVFAAITWPRLGWRPLYGTRKPNKKECRS